MFDLMSIIVPIIFIIVIGIIVFSLGQGIVTWNRNNQSPRSTVSAVIIAKRENITHHQHANAGDASGAHGFHTTTNTMYYVTFQTESGDRMEFQVSGTEYGMLAEGDTGRLTFQGTRYLAFEIVNLNEIANGDFTKPEGWQHKQRSGETNPLGVVPIVEYFRSYDRMGVWEHQQSELDNLNLLISDFTNDVEQNTQAVWHTNDVEFPTIQEVTEDKDGVKHVTETVRKPKSGEWMQTYTTADGKTPLVESLAINYDYTGMLNNIQYRRNKILEKCNVPLTNDNASNITGVAASNASGWDHAEAAATKLQMITESCKMDELEVVLAAIEASPYVPQDSPLRQITLADIEVNIKRQKLYELSTKVNSIATLVNTGFDGGKVLNAIPVFDDPNEVWEASKDTVEQIQRAGFKNGTSADEPNAGRTMQDLSDQVGNSPLIDKSRTANN